MPASLARRLGAEFLGTFVLVFVGCGAAVLDAGNKGSTCSAWRWRSASP